MTARVVLACDGKEGVFDCRQAIPIGKVLTGVEARRIAKRDGWSSAIDEFLLVHDFCPRCTRER